MKWYVDDLVNAVVSLEKHFITAQWDNVMLYWYFDSLINTTTYTLTLSTPLSCSIRFRSRNYLAGNLLVVNSVSLSTQSVSITP